MQGRRGLVLVRLARYVARVLYLGVLDNQPSRGALISEYYLDEKIF